MAPEILFGYEYSNGCDLYSIGATIYYLYFGKYPFNRKYIGVQPTKLDIKINGDKQLEDLINKLLKKMIKKE